MPCETQQPPDLRSNPSSLPTPINVDLNNPQVKAGVAAATAKAVAWLRKTLKQEGGSAAKLKVSSTPLAGPVLRLVTTAVSVSV